MHSIFRSRGLAWDVAFVGFALAVAGCSCGGGSMNVPVPIMVSLPVSTVGCAAGQNPGRRAHQHHLNQRDRTGVRQRPANRPAREICGIGYKPIRIARVYRKCCDPGRHLYPDSDGAIGRANRIDELHLGRQRGEDGKHYRGLRQRRRPAARAGDHPADVRHNRFQLESSLINDSA